MIEPYFTDDRCTIYHGDTLHVLAELPEGTTIDTLATDPPYSSGGQFRGDRTASTVSKYVNSATAAYRPEFSGDTRDARSYLAWVSLWSSAVLRIAAPGAVAALFTDWRQLPTTTDALQSGGWVWRGIAAWDKGPGARPILGGFRNQCEYVVWGTAGPRKPDAHPVALAGTIQQTMVRDRLNIAQKPIEVMRWILGVTPPPRAGARPVRRQRDHVAGSRGSRSAQHRRRSRRGVVRDRGVPHGGALARPRTDDPAWHARRHRGRAATGPDLVLPAVIRAR